jgi:hypothetical protein
MGLFSGCAVDLLLSLTPVLLVAVEVMRMRLFAQLEVGGKRKTGKQ